ncbi:MAG TPA: citryl-CoA lyase [Chloroflexota bacterium]|nr:citryl-CoA lyase [Chloroflexota bacterium]
MERQPIRTRLARVEKDRILVRGRDLCQDLLGNITFSDMAGLVLMGRMPNAGERRMIDAMLVVLVEHGMVSSVVSARLTYATAPESIQAAVAASLLGAGSVHLGSSDICARMLYEGLQQEPDLDKAAANIVRQHLAAKVRIPGIGHRTHPAGDPRAVRLLEIAREGELYGTYCQLLEKVVAETERQGPRRLPINVTGAIGCISLDLGLPWQIAKGFALVGRTLGTMAHLREEIEMPAADAMNALIRSSLEIAD